MKSQLGIIFTIAGIAALLADCSKIDSHVDVNGTFYGTTTTGGSSICRKSDGYRLRDRLLDYAVKRIF
jgi:hypothetical protein